MEKITYEPIGVVESPFDTPDDVPRPGSERVTASGILEIASEFEPGLHGLEEFSHIIVLTHLHEVSGVRLQVRPMGGTPVGILATSGPPRPNPIGHSVLTLDDISGTTLSVSHLDLIDGTPILDIKPYAPKVPAIEEIDTGWMDDISG
jgi:tRNA-Thr(GGU) m(6)t(6)A37 methyltransferase TsaA